MQGHARPLGHTKVPNSPLTFFFSPPFRSCRRRPPLAPAFTCVRACVPVCLACAAHAASFFAVAAFVLGVAALARNDWTTVHYATGPESKFAQFGVIHKCDFPENSVTASNSFVSCCVATSTSFCELFDEESGCTEYSKLQTARAFAVPLAILSGIAALAIVGGGSASSKFLGALISFASAIVGVIAFATVIDLKQHAEDKAPNGDYYASYAAGFGLFTAAWLSNIVGGVLAIASKGAAKSA